MEPELSITKTISRGRVFIARRASRADEPGSGRVSGARTIELPRWPLASLASAATGGVTKASR